jgi:hypothetical protein
MAGICWRGRGLGCLRYLALGWVDREAEQKSVTNAFPLAVDEKARVNVDPKVCVVTETLR